MEKILGSAGLQAFEDRGISADTAVKFGIYTGRKIKTTGPAGEETSEVVPDERGNVIVFPYEERGAVVAEKYRQLPWAPRIVWQRPGGRRTFWNSDILDDPGLVEGHAALMIVEGEPDGITAVDCGFPFTVSVPDGAPSIPKGREPEDLDPLDPATETNGKFEFLWLNRDRLKRVKRFIIAVDNDGPGKRLAAELVRRLSAARCSFVTYPEGCKDLNEVRMQHGPEAVAAVINGAKPYPVRGLYRLSEYPELPEIATYSTGWSAVDRYLKVFAGEFMVVTGIPGHGKSTWVLNLVSNLAERYGWRSAIFSPEMPTVPQLRDKLRRIKLREAVMAIDVAKIARADAWINDMIVFIDADPTGRSEEDIDLDWILDRATDAVLRDGIRLLVIDPWNEIEHARRKDESGTDYISRAIRSLKRFAHLYGIAVIVVAHPTKDVGKDGKSRPVSLYDIEGSAAWFNKCDHGVVIDRPDPAIDMSVVRVAKVRFEETGDKGQIKLKFDRFCSRYDLLDPPPEAL